MKSICVIGNSHLGAVVKAYRETALGRLPYNLSFMGAAWPQFDQVRIEERKIVGTNFALGDCLYDLQAYDAFVVYGGLQFVQQIAQADQEMEAAGFSIAVRRATINDTIRIRQGYKLARSLSLYSGKEVFVLSNNPRADTGRVESERAFRNAQRHMTEAVAPALYIPHPDAIFGDGFLPKSEYFNDSVYLDGSARHADHVMHDIEHMNTRGGALVLQQIVNQLDLRLRG